MSQRRVKIGLVGCGNISSAYLKNMPNFDILDVAACADLLPERAQARAAEFNIPCACSVEEMLADPEIEIVVNLTIPKAHYQVALAALKAGKCAYTEKPMALTREQGQELLQTAKAKGLLLGGAPDTFFGASHQTCRKLIDDGWIGAPVAATAFMLGHGPEGWHPDPAFYYEVGGGPMFDMGPYYLTALVNLMGPVQRVTGSARITFPERTITSQPKYGTVVKVETPTHVAGVLDFASGAVATIITSFDVWGANLPRIEIYGSEGSLSVPDPNNFVGPIMIRRAESKEWAPVPDSHNYTKNRGIGVADMAYALRSGRPNRASGELTYHVLDIMHAVHDASRMGKHVQLNSTCQRPAALPVDLAENKLDM
jgi:predicted dehydrogenase